MKVAGGGKVSEIKNEIIFVEELCVNYDPTYCFAFILRLTIKTKLPYCCGVWHLTCKVTDVLQMAPCAIDEHCWPNVSTKKKKSQTVRQVMSSIDSLVQWASIVLYGNVISLSRKLYSTLKWLTLFLIIFCWLRGEGARDERWKGVCDIILFFTSLRTRQQKKVIWH